MSVIGEGTARRAAPKTKMNALEMDVGHDWRLLAYLRDTFRLDALLGRLLRGLGGETGENAH